MEQEFGQSRRGFASVVGWVRGSGARAPRLYAGALLLALAMSACGGDESTPAVTSDTSSQTPAPGPSTAPDTVTPANPAPDGSQPSVEPSSSPPSASEGAANEMIPLEPGAMDGESSGEAPVETATTDEPTPAEEAPPVGETPAEPTAFNPCPTDGSACRIMPLGDSITDGIGSGNPDGGYRVELLRQAINDGHSITFVGRQVNGPTNVDGQPFPRSHEGYPGATIATGMNQLANRVEAALTANPPDIVLLHIGTNDIYQGMPANLPAQLGDLLDQITAGAPDALVVVAQITPVAEAGAPFTFPNNGVDEYNAAVAGVVQQRAEAGQHLLLVDMNAALRASQDFVSLLAEGLHPNNAGYAIMASTWYDAIEGVLP